MEQRLLALALASSVSAQTTATLSDAQVREAIRIGESGQAQRLTVACSAYPSPGETMTATRAGGLQRDGGYSVVIATAAGEVASRAAAAKGLARPLTVDDVTDDMRTPGLVVMVEPGKPSSTSSSTKISIAATIQYVVLKSRSKVATVARADSVDTEPVELSDLQGGKVQGNRAVARFSLDAVRELPAGDLDVVVITREGERSCKISKKDRAKLVSAR